MIFLKILIPQNKLEWYEEMGSPFIKSVSAHDWISITSGSRVSAYSSIFYTRLIQVEVQLSLGERRGGQISSPSRSVFSLDIYHFFFIVLR